MIDFVVIDIAYHLYLIHLCVFSTGPSSTPTPTTIIAACSTSLSACSSAGHRSRAPSSTTAATCWAAAEWGPGHSISRGGRGGQLELLCMHISKPSIPQAMWTVRNAADYCRYGHQYKPLLLPWPRAALSLLTTATAPLSIHCRISGYIS